MTPTTGKNDLLAKERRDKILELIQEEGSARVKELSSIFKVSEPTIRQDLERLDEQGYVTREHGGAFLRTVTQQVSSLTLQHRQNLDKKSRIARKAAEFVFPGERIILDSGSTMTELAKCISGTANLTVITNALNIALIMGANPTCELMVTGGEFKAPTLSLTGDKAALFFNNIYVDKLFLATGGISPNFDLTYPGFSDIVVKNAMLEVARETYLLADSTKFGKVSFASFKTITCVQYLITDDEIDPRIADRISALGVKVITA
ncbi:MAG: DeoR/GlpR family DNA-binding transcription regulator [Treponema sp.]|nr:DeoR/GlpR family DNA-binding transcription regulator [Treponema sp.]